MDHIPVGEIGSQLPMFTRRPAPRRRPHYRLGWRAIFLINVPIGIVTIAAAARHLADSRSPTQPRLDVRGAALLTAGLAAVILTLTLGGRAGGAVGGGRGGGAGAGTADAVPPPPPLPRPNQVGDGQLVSRWRLRG